MGTGMTFQAWRIAERPTAIAVSGSPAGRIDIVSWSRFSVRIGDGGSAIVLPTEPTSLVWPGMSMMLNLGCYALVPGGTRVVGGAGLIIHTPDYIGLSQGGGPVEDLGRLKYIDGCSDSLLVCPARLGDPCLNLLHLPPGTAQTEHTHPSDRIGIILRGAGVCRTADGDAPLAPGMFWYIPTGFAHSFHTPADESLDVLAWHPDSDFGPSHDWHPMINRTIVDGDAANAARHSGIRTT
jgi:Cupin domain